MRRLVSSKLESIYKIANGSAHYLLACDAAFMIVETSSVPSVRAEWTSKARRNIEEGYGFRKLDLDRIESDGPFDDLL